MKNGKRILSVTVKRMTDDNPDTSWLGEYSNKRRSEFDIDREHSTDCRVNTREMPPNAATHNIDMAYAEACNGGCADCDARPEECKLAPCPHYDASEDCDCGGHGDRLSRDLQFFQASLNYVDRHGKPVDGNTPEEIRKYVLQDYERMESLNRGAWCFMGIDAEAEIGLPQGTPHPVTGQSYLIQRLTSGGLWGIESDSERSYIEEEEKNQLSELRGVLRSFGFTTRQISAAFKNVEHKEV